ncbi:diguanylate cyclase [Oceanispirochaeta sp. M1]|uniref:sensor domain-containing diguanylate cyclase n=1 Tax=Oceanispirochaeta sp. M1 TaxID=2283433 RepID=UPI000E09075A|nr:diguanylate cyclase [Oceanispirochaeta sp. M1]RDG31579.1 diguanylate cyclase [Oceanispirochaeta sp. M1]
MFFTEISVLWAILIISSSVLALYLSAYSFFRRQVSGAIEFSIFMFTIAMYSLGYAFEINAVTIERILNFIRFQFLWTTFTAPIFLLFVLRFIRQKPIKSIYYFLLFIIPVIIAALGLTIDSHTLLYRSYYLVEGDHFPLIRYEGGSWYAVQQIYLIGTSLAAEILLLVYLLRTRGTVQKQAILIFIASVMPTVNAILQPERSVNSYLDLQPFVMLLMGILLSIALFRFQMLDLVRAARWMAVDSIHDILLILDKDKNVQDINNAGKKSELLSDLKIGFPFCCKSEFSQFIMSKTIFDDIDIHKRTHHFDWNNKSYKFTVSHVLNRNEEIHGYAFLINENTEVVKLMNELERQAIYDELTSMFNRRQLINLANREIEIAQRNATDIGIIILDLDYFKLVNDRYGHLAGDKVLISVAACIRENLRTSEISGRYGGEEFCIICPQSNGAETYSIAERLRTSIERLVIDIGGDKIKVTASFGVHSTPDITGLNTEVLLQNADSALYEAKETGRNRSVLWSEIMLLHS